MKHYEDEEFDMADPVLKIKQGATYAFGFTWHRDAEDAQGNPILDSQGNPTPGDPYELTGCSARMQICRKAGDPPLVYATSEDPFLDDGVTPDPDKVAQGAGRIVLEGGDGSKPGHIRVTLTASDTMKLALKNGGVFDLEIQWPLQPGVEIEPRVDQPLAGTVTVRLNVTTNG